MSNLDTVIDFGSKNLRLGVFDQSSKTIYSSNIKITEVLESKNLGKKIENGKKMFIHQAAKAFKIWHGIEPKINEQVIGLLDK